MPLSPREREVLQTAALGFTDKEIASHLRIDVQTVKSHMSHIRMKLGITRRVAMVLKAIQDGHIVRPNIGGTSSR